MHLAHVRRFGLLLALAVAHGLAAAPAAVFADAGGQGAWTSAVPAGSLPPNRYEHASVFDPAQNRMVVFGGDSRNDTWALTTNPPMTWSQVSATGAPPPALRGCMGVYDESRDRLAFYNSGVSGSGNLYALSNLWVPQTPLASGRLLPSVVYDVPRDRLIVYGGLQGAARADVWAYSFQTNTWAELLPTGTIPPARWAHAAIYDPIGDRMIVFSGRDAPNDAWQLTLSGNPAWSPLGALGTAPSSRGHSAVAYDSERHRMLIHGGYTGNRVNDTWALNLNGTPTWEQLTPTGTLPPGNTHMTAVFDAPNSRLIMYGGFVSQPVGQVWILSFTPVVPFYTLNVSTSGSGSVTRSITQPLYQSGTPVTLTAVPEPGWHLAGWSGDASGTDNPLTITMDANKSITATFAVSHYLLDVAIVGVGTVTRSPDQPDYLYGDIVTLTATAGPGHVFAGWSGDAAGPLSPTDVTMNADRLVTATFENSGMPSATVVYPNGGEIFVVGSPYKLTWVADDVGGVVGVDLEVSRDDGVTYEPIAAGVPNTGSYVWEATGPAANTSSTPVYAARLRVTAIDNGDNRTSDESDAAFALFDLTPAHLVTITRAGKGSVTRTPDQSTYEHGTMVTLAATPDPGWEFIGWSGDTAETLNPIDIPVDHDRSITATFRDAVAPAVSIIYPNGGEILITGSPYKIAWDASDAEGIIAMQLAVSRDSGATWETLADMDPGAGSFIWIASRPGGNAGETPVFRTLLRVTALDGGGNVGVDASDTYFAVHDLNPLAVDASARSFELRSVSPNPTAGSSAITFALPVEASVRVSIFDLQGREVAVLADGVVAAGSHRAVWDPFASDRRAGAGVYFVRYRTPRVIMTRRIVVTR